MEMLQWDQSLSVGVKLIDDQHKKWIDYYNTAAQALAAGKHPPHIIKTLSFLIEFTHTHFATEEKHMADHGYPDLQAHKAKHDELRETLADLERDFKEEGATNILANAIDTFLGNWLTRHIQEVDMKLGQFFKEKQITLPDDKELPNSPH